VKVYNRTTITKKEQMSETSTAGAEPKASLLRRAKESIRYRVGEQLKAIKYQRGIWKHLRALSPGAKRLRILMIDDRVPHYHLGAGLPRTNFMLTAMAAMGYQVTFYPLSGVAEDPASVHDAVPREVEVMLDHGPSRLGRFLKDRDGYYDLIIVSRPHNMKMLTSVLERPERLRIVYDAEALFCMRDVERARLQGKPLSAEEVQKLVSAEVSLAEGSLCVASVSEGESRWFSEYGFKKVYTLSHAVESRPTPNPFQSRRDLLFVGPVRELTSPNGDAVAWFVREVFPLIRKRLGEDVKFLIAGPNTTEVVEELKGERVEFLGRLDDLTDSYNRARLFVAPTRFSAGIPLKILEAASYGLPVVGTSLVGAQLGWRHETELLLAQDAEGFAAECIRLYRDEELWNRLRSSALKRVNLECSPEAFSARLKLIIEESVRAPVNRE
jgi:glycosyltransferase involved in cell wall biosynthesis